LRQGAASDIGKRDRVLFALLLRSGMRLAAALALDAEDLDLDAETVVTRAKHARFQRIFLTPDVVRLLRGHLRETSITSGPLFRSTRGLRLSAPRAQYRFHAVCELAKIERHVTVHSLRLALCQQTPAKDRRLAHRAGRARASLPRND
jgi:integrase